MEGERSPPRPSQTPKAKFSVYQNPNFAAALTARSLQPSPSALLLISSSSLASAFSLIAITSREDSLVKSLTRIRVSLSTAQFFTKVLEAAIGLVFVVTLSALIRALSLLNTKNALGVAARSSSAASPSKKPKEQKNPARRTRNLTSNSPLSSPNPKYPGLTRTDLKSVRVRVAINPTRDNPNPVYKIPNMFAPKQKPRIARSPACPNLEPTNPRVFLAAGALKGPGFCLSTSLLSSLEHRPWRPRRRR